MDRQQKINRIMAAVAGKEPKQYLTTLFKVVDGKKVIISQKPNVCGNFDIQLHPSGIPLASNEDEIFD